MNVDPTQHSIFNWKDIPPKHSFLSLAALPPTKAYFYESCWKVAKTCTQVVSPGCHTTPMIGAWVSDSHPCNAIHPFEISKGCGWVGNFKWGGWGYLKPKCCPKVTSFPPTHQTWHARVTFTRVFIPTLVSVTCCPPSHQSILLRKLLKGSKDMHPGCVTWVPYHTDDWCMGVRQSPMQRNPSILIIGITWGGWTVFITFREQVTFRACRVGVN